MLKFIASLSLAALLSFSPAFADEAYMPQPAPKCINPGEVIGTTHVLPVLTLIDKAKVADFIKKSVDFMASPANSAAEPVKPEDNLFVRLKGIDQFMFFTRRDGLITYVAFVEGCAKLSGNMNPELLGTLIGEDKPTPEQKNFSSGPKVSHPADDGKI